MSETPGTSLARQFDEALRVHASDRYVLQLYVTGATPRSIRAIQDITRICQEHLAGRFELEVIDIYQQPERLEREQLVALPTLVKQLPLPIRRLIGDMSTDERVLIGLGLRRRDDEVG